MPEILWHEHMFHTSLYWNLAYLFAKEVFFMEGIHNVKESRSRWINPDAWLRIYRFADVFERL